MDSLSVVFLILVWWMVFSSLLCWFMCFSENTGSWYARLLSSAGNFFMVDQVCEMCVDGSGFFSGLFELGIFSAFNKSHLQACIFIEMFRIFICGCWSEVHFSGVWFWWNCFLLRFSLSFRLGNSGTWYAIVKKCGGVFFSYGQAWELAYFIVLCFCWLIELVEYSGEVFNYFMLWWIMLACGSSSGILCGGGFLIQGVLFVGGARLIWFALKVSLLMCVSLLCLDFWWWVFLYSIILLAFLRWRHCLFIFSSSSGCFWTL